MNVQTFFCEPTGLVRGWLRRYVSGSKCPHPANHGYHNAERLVINEAPALFEATEETFKHFSKTDRRWPQTCECGYVFNDDCSWQYMTRKIYRRLDTGQTFVMRPPFGEQAPLGAMWDANWDNEDPSLDRRIGADRIALQVMIPYGHVWTPDARASNCTSPCKHCGVEYQFHKTPNCSNPGDGREWTRGQYQDSVPEHRCWVRHGDPRTGVVHVDKNGLTCRAGAGSILFKGNPARGVPDYHGFLHHGKLTNC